MLWFYKRFDLRTSNFPPSIVGHNIEHMTFWLQQYLWTKSTGFKSLLPVFSNKKISTFLYRTLQDDCLFKKIFLSLFVFLFWKQIRLIFANKNCLFAQFCKGNIDGWFYYLYISIFDSHTPWMLHLYWFDIYMGKIIFRNLFNSSTLFFIRTNIVLHFSQIFTEVSREVLIILSLRLKDYTMHYYQKVFIIDQPPLTLFFMM